MFFKKSLLFLVAAVFVICESGFVENLGKCLASENDCDKDELQATIRDIASTNARQLVDTLDKCKISDGNCQRDLIQSVIRDISKTGVKELGIPTIDPIELKNISFSVLNALDITLIEGSGKGIKDCIVDRFFTDVEAERAFMELTCDITVKGRYKVFSNSPLIKTFTGGDTLSGDGNGKVKIDKLHLRFDFDFFIQRRDGEIYIKCKDDKIKYTYNIGKMLFFADNLYIGKQESSALVTRLLNDNWRMLLSTFGKPFMDKAMDYVYIFLHGFFETVPAKHFISDDLSKYARDA
uniref:Odorant binding protein n=1 Tax=Athetis dissimilis TaxID=1737331 RepID=A0A4D6Q6J1_ATHDI|nr:odorant binding protein [Athetis dissimilis]